VYSNLTELSHPGSNYFWFIQLLWKKKLIKLCCFQRCAMVVQTGEIQRREKYDNIDLIKENS
jgi:hypothetical protein